MRFSLLVLVICANLRALAPDGLRCEYLSEPMGIDTPHPRLSWEMQGQARGLNQSAYRVLVSSSPRLLAAGTGDLWDSLKVVSPRSTQIEYAGRALTSRQHVWWKVRIWDERDKPSPWSRTSHFSVGQLSPSDWQGRWIHPDEAEQSEAAILMRAQAKLKKAPRRATAFISGLGYYELYLNGQRVGDQVLDPAFSNYNRSVYYATHDVSRLLRAGTNTIAVILGNGFFNMPTRDLFGFEKAPWKRSPQLLLDIEVERSDGSHETIASGTGWKWTRAAIVFNCIRGGETYDARLEQPGWELPGFDDSRWRAVAVAPPLPGRLRAQMMPPLRVTEVVRAVKLTQPQPGVWVYDFGVNLTGWARFEAQGESGRRIELSFSESLKSDGTVDPRYSASHTYGRYQTGVLITAAKGRAVFEPRFTYHGFRYVEVRGLKDEPALGDMLSKGVNTAWASAGEFSCSDPRINRWHAAAVRTLRNCTHSIPGEEPTREKMGWTEDGLGVMESCIYDFEAAPVYRKYLQDMIDAQEPNGHVPPIVPTNGWGNANPDGTPHKFSDPWWGGTLPYVAWKLYAYYGDRQVLEDAYDPMVKWLGFLDSTARDSILEWGLGDWLEVGCKGRPIRTPVALTSTAGYYMAADTLRKAALVLGKQADALRFERQCSAIKAAFNGRFLDRDTHLYALDSQTAQAMPLAMNLTPLEQQEQVLARLIGNIHGRDDHISTGFLGVLPLMYGLVDWGHGPLAWRLFTQTTGPGWLHMVEGGKSTLSESLEPDLYSAHHPFGAYMDAWLYRVPGGIEAAAGTASGRARFVIRPEFVPGLEWVKASYHSLNGRLETAWRREPEGRVVVRLTIPANTEAEVWLSGRPANRAKDIGSLGVQGNRTGFLVGSGQYVFATVVQEEKR